MADEQDPLLRQWLYLIALLVLVLVVLGAVARLDHSGPFLGTFAPITSFMPPLSAHAWQAMFDRFRQIPGFSVDEDAGLTLAGFEHAYLLEWARLLAEHVIDIVLLAGFAVLIARGRRGWRPASGFLVLIALGAAHALLGWWLGLTGLSHRKDLMQFVVAARLTSACLLFAWSIWLARRLAPARQQPAVPVGWLWAVAGLGALVFVQMICGAFVAGLRAGTSYNTWPLIDGALVPPDLWFFSPWWKNLVENPLSVQFAHRMLGYGLLLYAAALLIVSRLPSFAEPGLRRAAAWLAALVLVEACLGVATILSVAWLPLAIAHVAIAFALVGLLAAHMADLSRAKQRADGPEPAMPRTVTLAE